MSIPKFFSRKYIAPQPKEYTFEQALEKIKEGAQLALECGCDPERLHCRGCVNSCLLSKAKCELGRSVAAALHKGESLTQE